MAGPKTESIFALPESLQDMTLHADWDYFISMVTSLRINTFEHGGIPRWNFLLCGGTPELANPQSWAFSWPSIFVYAFSPIVALFTIWVLLIGVGATSTYFLLNRKLNSPIASLFGALTFAFSGFFAAHLNQGHMTFAFCYLVPALILSYDILLDRKLANQSAIFPALWFFLVSFCFFSSALPAPLFYFYPAFIIYFVCKLWSFDSPSITLKERLLVSFKSLVPHFLALLCASYKLWPVIAWQLKYPRHGVESEYLSFSTVFGNTLRYDQNLAVIAPRTLFPGQLWGAWEYNAFLGPLPWLMALWLVAYALYKKLKKPSQGHLVSFGPIFIFGLVCATVGILLASGNQNLLSPTQVFQHLPFLRGIRVFSRYQVLIAFGLAILAAIVWANLFKKRSPKSRLLGWVLAIGTIGPVFLEFITLVSQIEGIPTTEITTHLQLQPAPKTSGMLFQDFDWRIKGITQQTAILNEGYLAINCYDPLNVPTMAPPKRSAGTVMALSEPPPQNISIGSNSIALTYPAGIASNVILNLPTITGMEFSAPFEKRHDGRLEFPKDALNGKTLYLRNPLPDDFDGLLLTLFGCLLTVFYFFRMGRCLRKDQTGEERSVS